MRKILAAATLFSGLILPAFAADLPNTKGPPVYAPPPPDWSGPYVGAFGGYAWAAQGQHDDGIPTVTPPPTFDGHYNPNGALGGGLIGYNFPVSSVILGVEGDIGVGSISGSSESCGTDGAPLHECGGRIKALSDVRGRIGLPLGQFLPFIAGGLAVDDIHAYDGLSGAGGSRWQPGWTAGAGIDYKVNPQISLRVEYLHQDFSRESYFDIVPTVPERIRTDVNIVRGAIIWNFETAPPAPVVAKY